MLGNNINFLHLKILQYNEICSQKNYIPLATDEVCEEYEEGVWEEEEVLVNCHQ
jgi:hypothetical protein